MQSDFTNNQYTNKDIVQVLVPRPVGRGFDYIVPDEMRVEVGSYVTVPIGSKQVMGVVWGNAQSEIAKNKCKPIIAVHSDVLPMSGVMRKFIEWVAWYNCSQLGMVLKMALSSPRGITNPPKKRNKKGEPAEELIAKPPTLTDKQRFCADELCNKLGQGFNATLLEGVTGSGKTEVYFEAIEKALQQGEQVLVLLPEIALSIQWLSRFKARFGEAACAWHSSIADGEKARTWRAVATGNAKIVVGARSALFLPFQKLGLIIVDEEHESSYKQEDGVFYHARDMAVVRANIESIPIILASATPSIETLENVENEKYSHVHLPVRFGGATMPKVSLIDMKQNKLPAGQFISHQLKEAIAETLQKGQQALLFLNRRGYAPLVLCRTCGYRFECASCSGWLVLHQGKSRLECHHCGYLQPMPKTCPECSNEDTLVACGPGVERLEEEVRESFKGANIATITSDSANSREDVETLIEQVTCGKTDILIGTQMLAKGHHFPNLTLVGVVDADLGLSGGDPRATEQTYQLLHQIAGRAGRAEHAGKVLLQTYIPEHPVMKALASYDGKRLIAIEKQQRKEGSLPPYGKLVAIIIEGKQEQMVMDTARKAAANFPKLEDIRLLGPAPAPLYRLRGLYRYRILIKAPRKANVQQVVNEWIVKIAPPSSIRIKTDIDPYSFL